MREVHAVSEQHRVDPPAARGFAHIAQMCLFSTGLIALVGLLQTLLDYPAREAFGRIPISATSALAILAASAGLALSFLRQSPVKRIVSILFGMTTAMSGFDGLIGYWWSSRAVALGNTSSTSLLPPIAFVLLGLAVILLGSKTGDAGRVADALVLGTVWIALILVFGALFDALHLFRPAQLPGIEGPALAAFVLLTLVALGRRAECGIFSTFLGHGRGSRMARRLLPLVLLLPILVELGRAYLMRLNLIGAQDAAALLAAIGSVLLLAAVMVISRRFKRFEAEIRELTLYDELTGLYNLRGFQLMADYVLRLSARSGMPFSILFVSIDNLTRVNETHGQRVASRLLAQTGELLRSQFRETDVVARIGDNEFVIAGSFSVAVIERAEQRILEPSPADQLEVRKPRLSLSTGYASVNPQRPESLQDLLQRADAAMYQRKRQRRLQIV